jgi:hypothetical protein
MQAILSRRWPKVLVVLSVLVSAWLIARRLRTSPVATPEPVVSAAPVTHETVGASAQTPPEPTGLSGAVRSEQGAPIGGARACATESGSEWVGTYRTTCVLSDATGHYELRPLPSGSYSVTAGARGFTPAGPKAQVTVFLAAGDQKSGVDLVLQDGAVEVAGTVLDATGGPVPGASVRATRISPPWDPVFAPSATDGSFHLWVEPGTVVLTAEADGYARAQTSRVAPSRDVVLMLTPGSSVSGRVVSAVDGTPVEDVEVRAVPVGTGPSPVLPSATSRAEGAFDIRGVEPGSYTLSAEGHGWRGQSSAELAVGLAQSISDVAVTVTAAAQVVARVVQRSDGRPVEQGTVLLSRTGGPPSPYDPQPESSDAPAAEPPPVGPPVPTIMAAIGHDGVVRFPAVTPGPYHVTIMSPSGTLVEGPRTLTVASSDMTDVVWKMAPGLAMAVRVVDEAGRPQPNARFYLLLPPRRDKARPTMSLTADGEGRYNVPALLHAGRYRFQPDVGYDGEPVDVDLKDGDGKVDVTLRLKGKASILVTVHTADGAPVDDVRVSATPLPDPSRSGNPPSASAEATRAGADAPTEPVQHVRRPFAGRVVGTALGAGRFRIGPIPGDAYVVQANDGTNPPAPPADARESVVRVASGSAAEVTITLDRGARIRGQVVDGAKQPVPDVWVNAECRDALTKDDGTAARDVTLAAPKRVVSSADGRFSIDGLAATAVCTVRANQPFAGMGATHDVRPGGDAITVVLPAVGALRGTVATADGQPVTSFMVAVSDPDTGFSRTESVSAPGGSWSLAKVVPGQLRINATDAQGNTAEQAVHLDPGQTLEGVRIELRSLSARRESVRPAATAP